MKQITMLLLAILINLSTYYHKDRWMYSITYQLGSQVTTEDIPEDQVELRLDQEYDSEYYDFLGKILHICPGRLLTEHVLPNN